MSDSDVLGSESVQPPTKKVKSKYDTLLSHQGTLYISIMPKVGVITKFLKNAKGFDYVIDKVKFLTANNGNCTAEMTVELEHTNTMGGLHGGFSATLVDVVSSVSLLTHEYGEGPSVSVNINMTYLKGAKIGDNILIESKLLRVGKTLAFLDVEIRNKKTNELLVKGEHTKFILGSPK